MSLASKEKQGRFDNYLVDFRILTEPVQNESSEQAIGVLSANSSNALAIGYEVNRKWMNIPFTQDEILIGFSPNCDILLPKENGIQDIHAIAKKDGDGYKLQIIGQVLQAGKNPNQFIKARGSLQLGTHTRIKIGEHIIEFYNNK